MVVFVVVVFVLVVFIVVVFSMVAMVVDVFDMVGFVVIVFVFLVVIVVIVSIIIFIIIFIIPLMMCPFLEKITYLGNYKEEGGRGGASNMSLQVLRVIVDQVTQSKSFTSWLLIT